MLHARSSSAPSLFTSRVAIYKPPRPSPLSGPVIALNDDGDEEYIVSNQYEKTSTRTNPSSSRMSSPYPTPPRTPSPNDDGPETETHVVSRRSRSSLHIPPLAYQPSVRPQARSPPQIYVRTPFSAPPTMRESHPTYGTADVMIARVDRRPRNASSPSSSPHERGTFSAPAVIRPVIMISTPEKKHMDTIHPQLDANAGNSLLSSNSSSPSRNSDLTWLTVSNGRSPPPFSRTRLGGVVMPVKASRAEKSTKRPKTAPTSRSSFLSPVALVGPAEGMKMLQPTDPEPLAREQVKRKKCASLSTSIANPGTEETDREFTVLENNNDVVDTIDEVVKAGSNIKGRKWKRFLEKFGNVVRN